MDAIITTNKELFNHVSIKPHGRNINMHAKGCGAIYILQIGTSQSVCQIWLSQI